MKELFDFSYKGRKKYNRAWIDNETYFDLSFIQRKEKIPNINGVIKKLITLYKNNEK